MLAAVVSVTAMHKATVSVAATCASGAWTTVCARCTTVSDAVRTHARFATSSTRRGATALRAAAQSPTHRLCRLHLPQQTPLPPTLRLHHLKTRSKHWDCGHNLFNRPLVFEQQIGSAVQSFQVYRHTAGRRPEAVVLAVSTSDAV